nr:MAG TPA: hypothetical protein [Caudoviricetes sp.]
MLFISFMLLIINFYAYIITPLTTKPSRCC